MTQDYLLLSFRLLGSLALLMYGMKTMSDALQKMAVRSCATCWEQ